MSSAHSGSRAWYILPVLGAGVLSAVIMLLVRSSRQVYTVTQVTREIHELALLRSTEPGVDDGGPIGPWWITATSVDPYTGAMVNFRLSSGDLRLSAQTAHLHVDAADDSFSFELLNVVYAALPDEEAASDHALLTMDRFVLGPAPYRADIVPDHEAAPSATPALTRASD